MTLLLARLRRWGAYGVYAILIFGLCVYLTFPSRQFHAWLIAEADRRFGVQITAQTLQSHSPLHVDLDGVTLAMKASRSPFSRLGAGGLHAPAIERLGLEVRVLPLVVGRAVLRTEIRVFGGVIRGTLTVARNGGRWRYHVIGDSENVHLQQLEEHMFAPRDEGQLFTAGTGAVQFDFSWTGEDIRSGAGVASVGLEDMSVHLTGLPPVRISALSGTLTRDERGWWRTDDVRVSGEDNGFTAAGQGRFFFEGLLARSMINLSMRITMEAAGKRQYPQVAVFMPNTGDPALLTVTGSLGRPVILVNGIPVAAP